MTHLQYRNSHLTSSVNFPNDNSRKTPVRDKGGTLTEVFTRDIEENPFEKGFSR